MQKFLIILRDPIWQMLGVIVAVIAIFISSNQADSGTKDLVSIHIRQGRILDQWMPGSKMKILSQANTYDSEKVIADYFILHNASSSPISPADFLSTIDAIPRQGATIKEVRSCSQSFAQACSSDGSTTPAGGAYVSTEWAKTKNKWAAAGPLINKDDSACIVIISEIPLNFQAGSPLAELSARVKGYNFRFFESRQAFFETKRRWYHSLSTVVAFEGLAVYWLVVLAGALLLANLRLLRLANLFQKATFLHTLGQVGLSLLCISTAEILTDVYSNKAGNFLHPSVHFIIWPLLAVHIVFVVWLFFLANRNRRVAD